MYSKRRTNPFSTEEPIENQCYFVGRTKIVEKIFAAMRECRNVSLRGERRIGKTSLLYHLAHPDSVIKAQLSETHIPVFFDFEPLRGVRTDDVWLSMAKTVAAQISWRIPDKKNASANFFTKAEELFYKEDFATAFSKALSELSDCKIHFLFDEFDKTENPELGESFYKSLLGLHEENKNISYVIATRTGACPALKILQIDYEQDVPAFQENEVHDLIFGYFSPEEERAGLAQRLCDELPSLYELTGYHPFFIQIFCRHLYRRLDMLDWPSGRVWNEALEAFKKQVDSDLEYYWQVSSSVERELTKSLAKGFAIDWNKPEIQVATEKLKNRCLLIPPVGDQKNWRLFSSVYDDWVKKQLSKKRFIEMQNPFIYGRPVQPEQHVNRNIELKTVFNRLRTQQCTAITGIPHIGKTSLLLAVGDAAAQKRHLGDGAGNFLFRSMNLHEIEEDYASGNFWKEALQIERETVNHTDIIDCLRECAGNKYDRFSVRRLFKTLAEKKLTLVLLLDEFDRLLSHSEFKNSPGFFGNLRSLATTSGSLALVTASRLSVEDMNQWGKNLIAQGSPFFNHFIEVRLKPFEPTAVKEFFEPHKNKFPERETEMLRYLAGSHPFLLQAAAGTWLDARKDPDIAASLFYERVSAHFAVLWDMLDNKMRTMAIMLCLAELSEESLDCNQVNKIGNIPFLLRILADWGLTEEIDKEDRQRDISYSLEYKGESWIISSRAFTCWLRNVRLKEKDSQVKTGYLLNFQQKRKLASLLLECPSIQNTESRHALLREFPPDISKLIEISDNNKVHMLNIVNICIRHADVLDILIDTLRFFDAETKQFQNVIEFMDVGMGNEFSHEEEEYEIFLSRETRERLTDAANRTTDCNEWLAKRIEKFLGS